MLLSDVSSDIRVICMGELGCWIRLYPDLFLDNNYLKYIGWMLYDKVRESRRSALCAWMRSPGAWAPPLQPLRSGEVLRCTRCRSFPERARASWTVWCESRLRRRLSTQGPHCSCPRCAVT